MCQSSEPGECGCWHHEREEVFVPLEIAEDVFSFVQKPERFPERHLSNDVQGEKMSERRKFDGSILAFVRDKLPANEIDQTPHLVADTLLRDGGSGIPGAYLVSELCMAVLIQGRERVVHARHEPESSVPQPFGVLGLPSRHLANDIDISADEFIWSNANQVTYRCSDEVCNAETMLGFIP